MNRAANQYGRALFAAARAEHGDLALKQELDKIRAASARGEGDAALALLGAELLGSFEDVYRGFAEQYHAHYGTVAVEVVSAFPVPEEGRAGLVAELERITGRSVQLTVQVDPALIGGVLLRFDGVEIDGSLRARLRSVRQRMGGAAL